MSNKLTVIEGNGEMVKHGKLTEDVMAKVSQYTRSLSKVTPVEYKMAYVVSLMQEIGKLGVQRDLLNNELESRTKQKEKKINAEGKVWEFIGSKQHSELIRSVTSLTTLIMKCYRSLITMVDYLDKIMCKSGDSKGKKGGMADVNRSSWDKIKKKFYGRVVPASKS